ncbi:MAG TPA: pyridoxal-dependent decarboxylase [Thermoanaerobaculia bacterium]|nr:pyridoxal-dependent decarboxylase [Thermoanaerobaculia bacterium]
MPKGSRELQHWHSDDLQRFLEIRQEFFLDPMGSNQQRFLEAITLLQKALFSWYLQGGNWGGMLKVVGELAGAWGQLRKEERRTMLIRRFALNSATPDVPAVESSVSEHQWQKIFGSLGLGLADPGTFDRFLVQLDEETNPSLRLNHRYMGELVPHDNMISYLSSITATFLNENAIIGKVSPCVTHMEQAAVKWMLTLVGWDGGFQAEESASRLPIQRLPTMAPPSRRYSRWEREEPTGTIVAGGTIANISAMLIARSALFDYLLGWPGAVQNLGPIMAWNLVRDIWKKERLVVLTSKGIHYSVRKAALQAGVSPANVIEIPGSKNPWVLDGIALERQLRQMSKTDLVLAVVAIAGKTETGYVDDLREIAEVLNDRAKTDQVALMDFPGVLEHLNDNNAKESINTAISTLQNPKKTAEAFEAALPYWNKDNTETKKLLDRIAGNGNEMENARHNRLFLHVDAAHGGGFLTVSELRRHVFDGIELADTITIDGHKALYCYYPCGGLLVRATRWAQTFSTGHSAYISEDENPGVYREGLMFGHFLGNEEENPFVVGSPFDVDSDDSDVFAENPLTAIKEVHLSRIDAVLRLTKRPQPTTRSELTHLPFNQYLEGSRGSQGIMQLYFNLATLGFRGYRSILSWVTLLRARTEEAISLGMSDLRLVTDPGLPDDLHADDKMAAIDSAGNSNAPFDAIRPTSHRTSQTTAGGRFLRLSDGDCNQILLTYIPFREAKLIATAPKEYWERPAEKGGAREGIQRVMRYLWRVNDHLWSEHIYANPHFSYYLGHTSLDLTLPSIDKKENNTNGDVITQREEAGIALARLLTSWNAWTRQKGGESPFFNVLCRYLVKSLNHDEGLEKKSKDTFLQSYARRFYCHKIVIMHPYTDESLLGDMLRRLAFWGERSVDDVRIADSTANLLFPDSRPPTPGKRKRK